MLVKGVAEADFQTLQRSVEGLRQASVLLVQLESEIEVVVRGREIFLQTLPSERFFEGNVGLRCSQYVL